VQEVAEVIVINLNNLTEIISTVIKLIVSGEYVVGCTDMDPNHVLRRDAEVSSDDL